MRVSKREKTLRRRITNMMLWSFTVVVSLTAGVVPAEQSPVATEVVVYKRASCGCCGKWVEHMEQAGFSVEVHNLRNLKPIKAELGLPRPILSCHIARVGDYIVEGHVPADLVKRLIQAKPDIKGLSVPGMPMGSPGMEGPRTDNYDVLTINNDGSADVFAHR